MGIQNNRRSPVKVLFACKIRQNSQIIMRGAATPALFCCLIDKRQGSRYDQGNRDRQGLKNLAGLYKTGDNMGAAHHE